MYVESLEGVSTNFTASCSDLKDLRPTFAFLVYPFVFDVAKDECPIINLLLSRQQI